jgi:hypothetical protein
MRHAPWLVAGVSKALWERARAALVDSLADGVWSRRVGGTKTDDVVAGEAMQRLAELARGDRDATLYGLKVAEESDREFSKPDR